MKYRGVTVYHGSYWRYKTDIRIQGIVCTSLQELMADSCGGIQRLIREWQQRPNYVWTDEPKQYRPSWMR